MQNDVTSMTTGVGTMDQESVAMTIKYATIVVATVPILCVYHSTVNIYKRNDCRSSKGVNIYGCRKNFKKMEAKFMRNVSGSESVFLT